MRAKSDGVKEDDEVVEVGRREYRIKRAGIMQRSRDREGEKIFFFCGRSGWTMRMDVIFFLATEVLDRSLSTVQATTPTKGSHGATRN